MTKPLLLSSVLPVLAIIIPLHAQSPVSTSNQDQLFRTISSLDTALFDSYNRCDLEKFGSFFVDDVEFYHDRGGVTLGRRDLTESIKNNVCGKVRRELVPGTLEVCPINGYGAVETGIHRFYHPGADKTQPMGEAKFVHLWQNKGGAWKITRVISYDHHDVKVK